MDKIKVIEKTRIYSGTISLRKDRFSLKGRIIEKEIVEHQNSVGVVVVSDDDVILVTQYRAAARQVLLEIPAGKIEKGERPEQAATREMEEEIGYAGKLKPLVRWYLAPGYDTEFMHIFVATDLKKIKRGIRDDDENIAVRRMTMSAALKKCFNGEIKDCKTVGALLAHHYSQSD
jgi:ADP-ribose pyrophosphatase